ncbi:MAG: CDP-glycerol glycerophosphotransferase family protein [Desulfovibrio sp.]|nr:CDP-glycerol glycerophosphotransferase family protein [Desulfovibrio sp.]
MSLSYQLKKKRLNFIYKVIACLCPKKYISFVFTASSAKYKNVPLLFEAMADVKNVRKITEELNFSNVYTLARSKIVVLDQSTSLTSNIDFKQTICVQLWHSSGLLKMVGFDALRPNYSYESEIERITRIHGKIDYFIISDAKLIPTYAKAFHKDPQAILPLGLIRTDELLANARNAPKNQKKRILFAPTFRNEAQKRVHHYDLEIDKLKAALGDSCTFLLRRHPTIKDEEIPKGWEDVSDLDQNELLPTVDLLITDYSSILFDFALLQRPIILFVPDFKEYNALDRHLYVEPDELCPKAVCTSTEEVIFKIQNNAFPDHQIKERFMSACDGGATARVKDFLLKLLQK